MGKEGEAGRGEEGREKRRGQQEREDGAVRPKTEMDISRERCIEFTSQLKMKLGKGGQALAHKKMTGQGFLPDVFHFSPVNRS